ncbi:hypothetical protein HMI55_000899 [Coelomomyces lativittatus]|nr:hypothetical protein HMI55_000899 [Coelomomyces lativittatus]
MEKKVGDNREVEVMNGMDDDTDAEDTVEVFTETDAEEGKDKEIEEVESSEGSE